MNYKNAQLRNLYYSLPNVAKNIFATLYSLKEQEVRYGGEFDHQLCQLKKSSLLSKNEIVEAQRIRLNDMMTLAIEHVPFYITKRNSILDDKNNISFYQLPLIDKSEINKNLNGFINQVYSGKSREVHTSGTTGTALKLFLTHESIQRANACAWFHYSWAGVQRGCKIATLAGHPVANPNSLTPPFWVFDRTENELFFSSQHITEKTLPYYAQALVKFQPDIIRGYPSSIYLLAAFLKNHKEYKIKPRGVFTSSETLLDFQRKVIEASFCCKALSFYGNTEKAAHILECSYGNYHIVSDVCYVEVLDATGQPCVPDEEGELVCTSLINLAMPLIRYRIGDRGIYSEKLCECGCNYPILTNITGRQEDYVVTPDGRIVGRLDHVFKDTLSVREAQIVQPDITSITVKIVPEVGYSSKDQDHILHELRLRLGPAIKINFEQEKVIPRTFNGKFRFVVSAIKPNFTK